MTIKHFRPLPLLSAIMPMIICASVGVARPAPAKPQQAKDIKGRLTLERIFTTKQEPLGGRLPRNLRWRPGHEAWVMVEREGKGREATAKLVQVDAATGNSTVLVASDKLQVPDGEKATRQLHLSGFQISPDGDHLLLPDKGDLYLYSLANGTLEHLAAGEGAEEMPTFSPDGRRLAYVRDNDLYVLDIAKNQEVRLTSDGSDTVFNGTFDWVYWEELADRGGKAFAWSSDGTRLVWLRLDDSPIPPFDIVDDLGTHSTLRKQYYPKAGDPSPIPSLHVARIDESLEVTGRRTVTFTDPIPYVPRFGFTPDDQAVWYQVIDRPENNLTLMRLDLATGAAAPALTEHDPYWVEPVDMMRFLPGGSLLWASRDSGYMHLQLRSPDGTVKDLTPGDFDVTALVGVDTTAGVAYYQAARPSPLERQLYEVNLRGGAPQRITGAAGSHRGELSPGAKYLLVTSSAIDRPPHLELFSSAGKHLRTIDANEPSELAKLALGSTRFLTVPADDGTPLNAMLLTPPNFDPHHRYPVVIYTYGGPHAQVVRNGWGRSTYLFHQWLAEHGFIVFSLDNRGSFARGREFEGAVDHHLGSSQLPDQLAGVRWLKQQSYVDPDHIGIWGWSYGGYFTCYALTHAPGVFAAGVAVAPVTDWKLYDSTYTERYMGTPAENPEGYKEGSVLEKVPALEDPLLVIHGTGDDNVHFQNTLQLANAAWKAGKRFDLMLFPNLKHGIWAPGSHLQVFSAIGDFFIKHLGG